MIVGFDHDDSSVYNAQVEFLKQARIPLSMSGMLYAIPKTPLHDRLVAEGRLDPADVSEFGTNVIPLKIGRQELLDGYKKVMTDLYDCDPFFARLDDLYLDGHLDVGRGRTRFWKRHRWSQFKTEGLWLLQSIGLFFRLMTHVPEAYLRREYRKRLWGFLKRRRNPGTLLLYVIHDRPSTTTPTRWRGRCRAAMSPVYNSY